MMDSVWLVLPKTKELVSPFELYDASKPIETAQPFTISLVSAMVTEDLDGILRGKNDVLILTRTALGEQPQVERIHFYEEGIPKGTPIRDLLANNVLVVDDYNGEDRVWLELNVVEVDTDTGERKLALNAFQSLAATAGAIFPVMIPYSFAGSTLAGLVEKLISALEQDEQVIKIPFSLYAGEGGSGKAPLQVGTYVVFARPQDPGEYTLQSNGLLTRKGKPADISYTVFDVVPQKQVSPKFVISQKVATLLTQLSFDNPNSAQSSLDFLKDTLTQYANFKKLNRYLDLKDKGELSEQERVLMAEIAKNEALKPFLPRG